jgi:hypothetical protein
MKTGLALSVLVAATFVAATTARAQDRTPDIERTVFELCPKVIDGSLALTDAGQTAAVGFAPAGMRDTPGGQIPRALRGEGDAKIVLAGGGIKNGCSVWFGGPDNKKLLKSLMKRAKAQGLQGGSAGALGDGVLLYKFVQPDAHRSLIIIAADAGGEVELEPATTAIWLIDKGE